MHTHTLITGMSGVGKTTVVQELRRRGHTCIEMDAPGWSYTGADGHQHWQTSRLREALDTADHPLFISGCAEEQAAFYPSFHAIVLLSIPLEIMRVRITARTNNSFGQKPGEEVRILSDLKHVEPLLRRRCTLEIVTTLPVPSVVDQIISHIKSPPP